MRHRDARNRLKQKPAHARMLKRNLLTSLLLYENVRTTRSRAKAVQPMVDRIISQAKKNPAHVAIRYINRFVTDKNASRKIMEVFIKRYADRPSGLTRIKPAGARLGDGAKLVDISFVEGADVPVVEEKEEKKAPAKKESKASKESEDSKEKVKKPAAKKAPAKKPAAKKATTTKKK